MWVTKLQTPNNLKSRPPKDNDRTAQHHTFRKIESAAKCEFDLKSSKKTDYRRELLILRDTSRTQVTSTHLKHLWASPAK